MKNLMFVLLLLLPFQTLSAEVCTTPCFYLPIESGVGVQLDRGASAEGGINFLSQVQKGVGVFASGSGSESTGVWAVGINGAVALKVQGVLDLSVGKISKPVSEDNILRVYDLVTGEEVGAFRFSFE
jgi:hypothetical protein